ncbi:MAG: GNAT family N-acetyltransferase [Gammaproteobacteria bacterium]
MFIIRPERPVDQAAVRRIQTDAFGGPAEAELVTRLHAAGMARVALVATVDAQIVGHVLLSPVSLHGVCTADGGLGLAPLGVLPAHQGRGIGSWLVVAAIAAARRLGARYVVLLGEPAFYARFGFETATRYGLDNEYGAGDAFQVLALRIGALPPEGGLIRYAPPFAALADTGPDA